MTAKESKAVACLHRNESGQVYWTTSVPLPDLPRGNYIPESALRAAEAELGELRRRVTELADSFDKRHGWFGVKEFTTELRQLLASDGGADGDNDGEGK